MAEKRKVEVRDKELKVRTESLECIGSLCFSADGSITVKIPKDADPRCARATADAIFKGKKVSFEIEASQLE